MKEALTRKILTIMDAAQEMALATLRDDGFPQNTVVTFVSDGLTIYFACGASSQKAKNISRDNRVSATMTAPYSSWKEIRGVSMSARAQRVTDVENMKRVGAMFAGRYPEAAEFTNVHPDDIAIYAVVPEVVSILDYTVEFGHTDQVIVSAGDITQTSAREPHIWLPQAS